MKRLGVLIFASLLVAGGASAQETADEIKDMLERNAAEAEAQAEDDLDFDDLDDFEGSQTIDCEADAEACKTLSLDIIGDYRPSETLKTNIYFELGSDRVVPELSAQLPVLCEVVAEVPDHLLVVEGHTSADGEDGFNLDLSQRRATALKAYLVENCGGKVDHIRALGKGESALLAEFDMFAPEQRRVEVYSVGTVADAAGN